MSTESELLLTFYKVKEPGQKNMKDLYYISFYSGYGEDLLIDKFELDKSKFSPIPRIGEKVVLYSKTYSVVDVVTYFEKDYEIALIVNEESANGFPRGIPETKIGKNPKKSGSKISQVSEKIPG